MNDRQISGSGNIRSRHRSVTCPLKVLSLVLGLASLLALLEWGWPTSIDPIPVRAQAEVDDALRLAVTEDTWYHDAETGPLRPGMDDSPAGADPILRVDSSNHSPQLAATAMKFEAIPAEIEDGSRAYIDARTLYCGSSSDATSLTVVAFPILDPWDEASLPSYTELEVDLDRTAETRIPVPNRLPLEDAPIRFDVTDILRHIGPHGIALYIEYISRSTTTCMLHDRQTEFPASLVIEADVPPRTLLLPSLGR